MKISLPKSVIVYGLPYFQVYNLNVYVVLRRNYSSAICDSYYMCPFLALLSVGKI